MGTGQEFAKKLGMAGAIFVLVLGIIFTAMLFVSRGTPVAGYEKPESDEYYSAHPEELLSEVTDRLLPLAGVTGVTAELRNGKISVSGQKMPLHEARLAIIHYFDEDLFEFTEVPE